MPLVKVYAFGSQYDFSALSMTLRHMDPRATDDVMIL